MITNHGLRVMRQGLALEVRARLSDLLTIEHDDMETWEALTVLLVQWARQAPLRLDVPESERGHQVVKPA